MSALVVGLDLSIAAPGFADIEGSTRTLKLPAARGDRRLVDIAEFVVQLAIFGRRADLVVIEDLPTHAHGAGITGMVHGAVRTVLLTNGLRYVTVPPATLKKYATGKGNANKTEMAMAAFKRFDREFADDNQCDAYWLRAAGLDLLGEPLVALPAPQSDALKKIDLEAP